MEFSIPVTFGEQSRSPDHLQVRLPADQHVSKVGSDQAVRASDCSTVPQRKEKSVIRSLARTAAAGAVIATVFAGTMSTAQAAEAGVLTSNKTISIPGGRGTMTFIDDGDMFQVCDTKADGHGVSGRLIDDSYREKIYITDGGDAGCDKKGYDVGQFGSYQMQLSWDGDGYAVTSEWFNE
ncbi:hypothetical protein ACFU98_18380 [Streptomyces sp. NPDC057575]|uniref:hypothetical protein n=1 Tax=unclassified Streptomyces TaxID=2593676 RepID=UPI0036C7F949